MSAVAVAIPAICPIAFDYRAGGEVLCRNQKGLVFFLRAEPPSVRPNPTVQPAAPRTWTPVEATKEVEVKRHSEPQLIAEVHRHAPEVTSDATVADATTPMPFQAIAVTREVEVRRSEPVAPASPASNRGTGALPNAPQPGEAAAKGWFSKLFKK